MARVKKGVNAHKRHKKVLKMAKGYYGAKSKTFRARLNGLSYSRLIDGLKKSSIDINRKMLSELAIHDPAAFAQLCETAKKAL